MGQRSGLSPCGGRTESLWWEHWAWNTGVTENIKPCACVLSHFCCVWLFVTIWTVALQDHLSKEFSRQEYWNGLPCPPPSDLHNPGIEATMSYVSYIGRRVSLLLEPLEKPISGPRASLLEWDIPEVHISTPRPRATQLANSIAGTLQATQLVRQEHSSNHQEKIKKKQQLNILQNTSKVKSYKTKQMKMKRQTIWKQI